MQKWEYIELLYTNTIQSGKSTDYVGINDIAITGRDESGFRIHAYLNKLGQEGWEMIQVHTWDSDSEHELLSGALYYFKRPIE